MDLTRAWVAQKWVSFDLGLYLLYFLLEWLNGKPKGTLKSILGSKALF